jgi:hypothetical protein
MRDVVFIALSRQGRFLVVILLALGEIAARRQQLGKRPKATAKPNAHAGLAGFTRIKIRTCNNHKKKSE